MSVADTIHEFIQAMRLEGLHPREPIADLLASGKRIRFECEGDGKDRRNCWAILHLDDRPAGAFGSYRTGIKRTWKSGSDRLLTSAERESLRREWAEAKRRRQDERERLQIEVAKNAQATWKEAALAGASHPYVVAKQLDPSPLRQIAGMLLIPVHDIRGQIWNLQCIAGDGAKRFKRGGRTEGLGCLIGYGVNNPATVCIGEGYATMAAVHRATGYPCLAALSAHNVAAAARVFHAARPELEYIVCADNDDHLPVNIGLEAAQAASREIGARLAVPHVRGDFDDMARETGLKSVSEAINGAR